MYSILYLFWLEAGVLEEWHSFNDFVVSSNLSLCLPDRFLQDTTINLKQNARMKASFAPLLSPNQSKLRRLKVIISKALSKKDIKNLMNEAIPPRNYFSLWLCLQRHPCRSIQLANCTGYKFIMVFFYRKLLIFKYYKR